MTNNTYTYNELNAAAKQCAAQNLGMADKQPWTIADFCHFEKLRFFEDGSVYRDYCVKQFTAADPEALKRDGYSVILNVKRWAGGRREGIAPILADILYRVFPAGIGSFTVDTDHEDGKGGYDVATITMLPMSAEEVRAQYKNYWQMFTEFIGQDIFSNTFELRLIRNGKSRKIKSKALGGNKGNRDVNPNIVEIMMESVITKEQ